MNYARSRPSARSAVAETETLLPMNDGPGLAATCDMAWISVVVMNMHMLDPKPRVPTDSVPKFRSVSSPTGRRKPVSN